MMKEEGSDEECNPIVKSKQRCSVQERAVIQKRASRRAPTWKSNFKIERKWSIIEKSRLLEALKRYDSHNISSIAKLVGTKSEEEVEEKIVSLRGIETIKSTGEHVDGPRPEKAPIEIWVDLVQEMTRHEPADYSQFIPKLLGLITRNEKFADSGYAQLKWRNIYQFLTDITDDRLEVQKLTDIESLVVLDMMHSLGDTLLNSNTSEQRQILDFKYNLLNFRPDNLIKKEREISTHRIAQALNNDFWDIDDAQQRSSQAHSSSLVMTNVTDATTELAECVSESTTHTSSSINAEPATPSSNLSTSCTDTGQHSNNKLINEHLDTVDTGSHETSTAKTGKIRSGIRRARSNELGKQFVRPKYFTLNPLCVPTKRLALKPKKVDQN